MRIGIDLRLLASGGRSGIEEYTINLLSRMIPKGGEKGVEFFLFYNAFLKASLSYDWLKHPNVTLARRSIPNKLLDFSSSVFNVPKIDKILGEVDVFFSPHFLIASLVNARRVAVFHDLSFLYYPEFFSAKKRLWHFFQHPRQLAEKADKIIAVSHSTKDDLKKFYGIKEEKIIVIHSGVSEQFRRLNRSEMTDENEKKIRFVQKKYHLPRRFILYLGTIEPRKNIKSIIRAFEYLKNRSRLAPDYKLVIAGPLGWLYGGIVSAVRRSRYANQIIMTGFVEDEDKPYIYNLADLFVYPSFFEGFGFPVLEAMACGAPVITSNNSSLPEVVAEAALMIDPFRTGELAEAIRMLLENKNLREEMTKRGLERAKKFSWDKCAEETLDVLMSNY